MGSRNNSSLDNEIKDIIQDVLNTKNFSRLNKDISRTVNHAMRDVEGMFSGKPKYQEDDILWKPLSKDETEEQWKQTTSKEEPDIFTRPLSDEEPNNGNKWNTYEGNKSKPNQDNRANSNQSNRANSNAGSKEYPTWGKKSYSGNGKFVKSPPGGVVGGVLMTFGILGIGFFGLALIVSGVMIALSGATTAVNGVTIGTTIPFFGISCILAAKGVQLRNRAARFRRYVSKLNGRNYCDIKELTVATGKNEKYIANDLQKMIHLGMFPQGHLDEEKTCFMLDDKVFKQYLETKKWTKAQQEQAETEKRELADKQAAQENESEVERQLRVTIGEGKKYIAQIKIANDNIPGEEFSNKLNRLETVISKIFKHIESHPEQIPEIRKFMNYYLPTTLKLTDAYAELDNQQTMGENISSAKNEIQKTLDTINLAFENLLDDLFSHAAMDISSEISVLETMLAQEGLTDKDFDIKNKKMEE